MRLKTEHPAIRELGGEDQRGTAGSNHYGFPSHYTPLPDDREIACAIRAMHRAHRFDLSDHYVEGFDTVRIAFSWLDAQKTVKKPGSGQPLKHVIENWGGRYVSTDAVMIAAELHPRIAGRYPRFNLSKKFTFPDPQRLALIPQAGLHADTYQRDFSDLYCRAEVAQ